MTESSDLRMTRMPFNHGGGQMPALGFGTLIPDAAATIRATADALEAGFLYRNEREGVRHCRQNSALDEINRIQTRQRLNEVVKTGVPGFIPTRWINMKTEEHPEQSMQEEQIREALNAHWHASAAGDANAEHDIYDDDVICDYPQSGERILGRGNLQALRSHHPGKPSGFNVKRIIGKGDLWITEYTITYQGRPAYTVSIMEFHNGKVVQETQYFADPFEAPAWRSQWVQHIA